jgi:hypothetical protein
MEQWNSVKTPPETKVSHRENYVEFGKSYKASMKNTPHVPVWQIAEE